MKKKKRKSTIVKNHRFVDSGFEQWAERKDIPDDKDKLGTQADWAYWGFWAGVEFALFHAETIKGKGMKK